MAAIRAGVIGAGEMGSHHIRIFSELSGVELVGIADVNETRAKERASLYNTQAYTDYRELLRQDIDAVSIAVPTRLHTEIALEAIDAGINILVEKPIADTLQNAETIISAARDANVKLMVGHIERFNPAIMKLKELLDSGLIGKIVSISVRRVGNYNPRVMDVGVILDFGVHDIDIISYLYGMKVNEVYSIAGADIHSYEDHAAMILRFNSEKGEHSGIIETNWLTPHKLRKLTAIGVNGVAYLDYIDQTLEFHLKDGVFTPDLKKNEPLRNELIYFTECIANNRIPVPSGEDGKYALKIALAAIESYKTGKAVKTL